LNNVRRNDGKVEKFTVDGKLFSIFMTRSAKKLLRILLEHRDLNSLNG